MNNSSTRVNNHGRLGILQYNLNRSQAIQHSLLNSPNTARYAILLLQEPHHSTFTQATIIHHSWTLIQGQNPETNRTVIYINKSLLSPDTYEPIHIPFPDTTAISIRLQETDRPSLIVNIYNPARNPSTINTIQHLQQHIRTNPNYDAFIIAGDFNLHHPLWNPPGYHRYDSTADTLIEEMSELQLKPILPAGTITFPRAKTAIDLVWGNEYSAQQVIKCKTSHKNDHGSDHYPIEIILRLTPSSPAIQRPYNYDKTDWTLLQVKLERYLPPLDGTTETTEALEVFARDTCTAIQRAVEESTPRKSPTPFSKRWWNDNLNQLRKKAQRTRREANRYGREQDVERWKQERREYQNKIKEAKRTTWRRFVKDADTRTIWQVNKYLNNLPTNTFVPTLNGQAISNQQKADLFQQTFFPLPPQAALDDIPNSPSNPSVMSSTPTITMQQVHRAISKLNPKKAPSPDEISNRVIKRNRDARKDDGRNDVRGGLGYNRGQAPKKRGVGDASSQKGTRGCRKSEKFSPGWPGRATRPSLLHLGLCLPAKDCHP